jgi:hypothetical protein
MGKRTNKLQIQDSKSRTNSKLHIPDGSGLLAHNKGGVQRKTQDFRRGGGPEDRPRARPRKRTFRPNYLSFAGTYQCNLSCPHCCVPIEWPDRLEIPVALRFLEDAHRQGIEVLGFTGGEPFIYPEFLFALSRRAAELGFRFDKVATNGVWFESPSQLEQTLRRLRDVGYTGKLGLSVDKFHGVNTAKAAEFCRAAARIFQRDNIISLSYASRAQHLGTEPIEALARELGAVIDWSDLLGRYMLVAPDLTITLNWNHLAPVERAERLSGAWDGEWFEEDYCEGPGQALIVNPKGEVKPCCGFASDLDQLTIGNIHEHAVKEIIRRARKHPYVGKVFREGLSAIRDEILRRHPGALPGATSNHCYFCWYVLTRGLAAGVNGGGGQIGAWAGERANFSGSLVEVGIQRVTAARGPSVPL